MKLINSLIIILFLGSCGKDETSRFEQSNQTCSSGMTSLAFHDDSLQVICGCDSITNGTKFYANQAINCLFPISNTIFIHFLGTAVSRQFVANGSPSVPSSFFFNANDASTLNVFTFRLDSASSYPFKDVFNPQMNGILSPY